MEYYLTIKRNEILTHAITRMNLETILSERSQLLQKTTIVSGSIHMRCLEEATLEIQKIE